MRQGGRDAQQIRSRGDRGKGQAAIVELRGNNSATDPLPTSGEEDAKSKQSTKRKPKKGGLK